MGSGLFEIHNDEGRPGRVCLFLRAGEGSDPCGMAADGSLHEKKTCISGMQVFLCVFLALQAETLVELGNASAGIDKLLLAGEERVTLRADFHANILLRRTCLNHITAGAFDSSLLIIGMDSFLHCSGSPLSGTLVVWFYP